ncbi:FAD-dependent monooxygenase [Mycobacterium palustre]|uniref:Monooxygenase n=1 Tax=Mycobacterium palustre TaxID=153971 RepID=A0A1X1Z5Q4_9MYCO|nr:NAD(P)/FAD-dependent oxidoreductase [Mycobacterium palustre]MCV7103522.1 FAD-dependent monooxygenase [Mycobacterium palustre]ORW18757.1 monooxygenase [Mycobacterium palustre]
MPAKGHVEIAGAGLAGLTAAAALASRGWSVRVHERGRELREIGAGIYLWENALRALEAVGAYDEVLSGGERISSPELRDHRHRLLQREWLRHGRLITIPRRALHAALVNAARRAGAHIETNSPVAGAHPFGALELTDGTLLPADVVIGADGVHSRVRESLGLTRKIVNLGDGCGRHLIPRTPEDPVNVVMEQWNGARRIGVVPSSPEWTYVFLCGPERDTACTEQQPFNRETWIRSFPHFRSQLERIPDVPEGRWAAFYDVTTTGWRKGRAVIIGDAAHAMSPNIGQAACMAMVNSVALAQALDRYEPDDALALWERVERPVTARVQRYSRLYGRVGTQWPDRLLDLRSALIWSLGKARPVQRRIQFAAGYFPALDTGPRLDALSGQEVEVQCHEL